MIAMDTRVPFVVLRVDVAQILELRHRVLRAGLPIEAAHFDGDERLTTWHIALKHGVKADEPVLCCASFMINSLGSILGWQLRGMATDPSQQKRGLGRILLENSETTIARATHNRYFWCNARVPAIPFYEKLGWEVSGEEFDIPTAGPHRVMTKIVKHY